MSRGITTAASTSPGLDLRDRLRARRHVHSVDLVEELLRVLADRNALVADLHVCSGRRLVDDRDTRARRTARDREADQQRDRDGIDDQQHEQQPRAAQDQQVLAQQPAHGVPSVFAARRRASRKRTSARSRSPPAGSPVCSSSVAGGPSNSSRPSARTSTRLGVALHLADVVGREQHARAPRDAPRQELPQPLALSRVERRGRLVERQHRRVGEQAERDVHALAVAAGEPADGLAGALASPVCSSIRATAARGSATRSRRANSSRFSATESFEYSAGCCGAQPTRRAPVVGAG